MSLMTPYLGHGRILCTDNFYTSVPLIEELSDQKTYFVGTYRKNRKVFPKEVTTAKLKRGECKSLERSKGVVALKWRDKRDVYCVSSKLSANMVLTGTRNKKEEDIKIPEMILQYNNMKSDIDISDQLSSYHSAIRKSVRWDHKEQRKMKLVEFRTKTVYALLNNAEEERSRTPRLAKSTNHYLQKSEVVQSGKTKR
ncbi:hypothetical protein NQ314_016002 [Rhamnusium bicolor]|uniref:PiggyBac transposable element-derived protein domain-containing protein n=1 Tax=Rhamnusium bicolor TaxID=1586634 RepID=A0AAV8WZS6_9CUCU|nr:hypothetical protein NQ314_016002 [Rhamnusium bicolor]